MKHIRLILIIILLTAITIIIINTLSHSMHSQIKVGVIDTNLSNEYILQYSVNNIMINNISIDNIDTHADMVVDTIKRNDSNCEIYLANVLNENSTGNISDIVKALFWLKEKEVDIVCMSFTTFEDNEQLRETINYVQKNGIIIVASCLNYSNVTTYPACYNGVISVANCNHEEAIISITSKIIKDELKATRWNECSTSILTAYITGKISKEMSKSKFDLDRFIQKYNT